jgi:hypothetical protein
LGDLRSEGVTLAMASDERLVSLLIEASDYIDHLTGWFFEPRQMVLHLDGRGTPSIEPPVPPIRLDSLSVCGELASMLSADLMVVGAPVIVGFEAPRLTLLQRWAPYVPRVFPKGVGNIIASGYWGYTEPDGTFMGRTPRAIRRATMLLVFRNLSLLGSGDSSAKSQWRILEERTRDQSYRLAPLTWSGVVLTGDPEIDLLLIRYLRPTGLGAA